MKFSTMKSPHTDGLFTQAPHPMRNPIRPAIETDTADIALNRCKSAATIREICPARRRYSRPARPFVPIVLVPTIGHDPVGDMQDRPKKKQERNQWTPGEQVSNPRE